MAIGLTVVFVICAAVFSTYALLPREWVVPSDRRFPQNTIDRITLLDPGLRWGLDGLALGCGLSLVAIGLVGAIKKRVLLPVLAFGLALGCPLSGVFAAPKIITPWTIRNELRAGDGETYYFMEGRLPQGPTLALARLREAGLFSKDVDVLVTTNSDHPPSFLRIIRPDGAKDTYGQLYLTEDGFLLGLRTGNRCFMAYDLKNQREYGHGPVEELSPFLCLGAKTTPHDPDIAVVLLLPVDTGFGAPKRGPVEAALTHANPRVREVAEKLLQQAEE
jgi:hypothetical protein